MIVYVETNFILELALLQEQHESCQKLIELCDVGSIKLALPAFCIAEPYETLIRRAKRRAQIANDLGGELFQLSRSKPYQSEIDAFQNITGLLVRSLQEEDQRLTDTLDRLLKIADVVPLEAEIIQNAAQYRATYKLEPQDSIVYASVVGHRASKTEVENCFINRNSRDFN